MLFIELYIYTTWYVYERKGLGDSCICPHTHGMSHKIHQPLYELHDSSHPQTLASPSHHLRIVVDCLLKNEVEKFSFLSISEPLLIRTDIFFFVGINEKSALCPTKSNKTSTCKLKYIYIYINLILASWKR